jgi:hypothetical protein
LPFLASITIQAKCNFARQFNCFPIAAAARWLTIAAASMWSIWRRSTD